MATNTLIQYLETERFGSLPGGSTEAVPVSAMNRRQVETFVASEAIAAGDVVSLDLSKTADGDKGIFVSKADTATATDRCAVGVALAAAAAAGDKVDVCVRGVCEANVDGATAAGDLLQISSTAGRLEPRQIAVDEGGAATFNLFPIVGLATEADVANVATIFVYKQF
jgi:hypothetical protein